MKPTMTTARTVLRPWADDDLAPFRCVNGDPRVMRFFPSVLTWAQSDELAGRLQAHFEREGFGPWVLEIDGHFAGFVGLYRPAFTAHFTPCVEVGWRLAPAFWGHGYATEAARAAVQFGFEQLGLDEIVSFAVPANRPSRAVMERLGMQHDERDDFDHPRMPESHPLRRHVLYRLKP